MSIATQTLPADTNTVPFQVLVVDDETDIARVLTRCLSREGYKAQAASTPSKALEMMASDRYNLLITDLKMPEMDGVTLTRKVKESFPDTEIVLMTGFGTVETAVGAMKLGAFDYVMKPFDVEQILTVVRRAVLHHNASREIYRYRDLDRMKEDFLSNVSHELRTPLSCIRAASELLLTEYRSHEESLKGATPGKMLNIINNSSQKIIHMVDDLLDMFRYEQGKIILNRVTFSLDRMVSECSEEFLVPCQERGLSLTASVQAGLPPLSADPIKIRQALFNLLGNAMKFTPKGGNIVVGARRVSGGPDEMVEIYVQDSGPGIPVEEQKKIFEKFYQINASITREKPGLGMGLCLVQGIAHAHEGSAGVESVPGQGSLFYLRLPVQPKAETSFVMSPTAPQPQMMNTMPARN